MARMTESEKKDVPKSERGIPSKSGTGSYPMPDARHAAAAIGFAAMHHGPAAAAKMRKKAHSLGYGNTSPKPNHRHFGGAVFDNSTEGD